jgi:hypothetical protein
MPEMINPLAAFRDGYNTVQGFRDDYAKRQAGNALAGGDYRGGANALLQNGMLQSGMDVMTAGQERNTAAQTAAKAKQTETLAAVLDGAKALRQVPVEQRQSYLQSRVLPLLQQRGATGDLLQQLSGLSGEDLSDQSLDGFATSLGGAMESARFQMVNNADVGVGSFDPRTGGINIQYGPQPKPLVVGEGQTVLDIRTQNQPQINESAARGLVASILPGVVVTSGTRTPERNAEVNGVKNSYHLRGQALDIKPPQGVSLEQFRQALEARGMPVAELIDEGNHWHLAWGAKADQGAPRVLAQGAPKPRARPATPQEKAAYGIQPNTPAVIKPDGSIDVINTGGLTPQQVAKDGVALRKEFNQLPDVKDFNNVATSFNVINRLSSQTPSAAGDLSLIFAYMKMLDPGSVVREGEFANAQNTAGIPDQVRNAYNKALNGQRLNPGQRKEFTNQAGNIYQSYRQRYDEVVGQYQGYAQETGLDPNIIQPRAAQAAGATRQAPAANGGPRPSDALKPGAKVLVNGGRPISAQEAMKLPKGARFVGTDGVERTVR